MEEWIDELDKEGNLIASRPKKLLKERMFLHKVSLVIPLSKKNNPILSLQTADKPFFPSTWCCAVGGKVLSGESEEDAAKREMIEEVGKSYPVKKIASFIYDEEDYKGFFTLFTTTIQVEVNEFKLDPKEIQYSKEFEIEKVMQMIKENPKQFAPTFIAAIKEFNKHYKNKL